MIKQLMIILIILNVLYSKPLSTTVLNKILEITSTTLQYGNPSRYLHGSEIICRFEGENRLGIAWLGAMPLNGGWSYNYVRLDSIGKILLDLRNLRQMQWCSDKYGMDNFDWTSGVPNFDYVIDMRKNAWLIYSYDTATIYGWHIGWMGIDSMGYKIEEHVYDKLMERFFFSCPAAKEGFYLLWMGSWGYKKGTRYCHYDIYKGIQNKFKRISHMKHIYKNGDPPTPQVFIETQNNQFLIIEYNTHTKDIECLRISNKGRFLSRDTLNSDDISAAYWEGIDLPEFYEIYHCNGLIYYVLCSKNVVKKIIFDNEGSVILPVEKVKGQLLGIDEMSSDAEEFIKIRDGIIYYYGIDNKANMFYWNSRDQNNIEGEN
jgi:hypothetical protein